jgi:hypothetical protein
MPSFDTIVSNYFTSILWPIYLPVAVFRKGSEEKTANLFAFFLWTTIIAWPY